LNASTVDQSPRPTSNHRHAERVRAALPARLTWKDQRGTPRFASVTTLDLSETGVFVECQTPISIAPFRLVQFQLERDARDLDGLPASLRQGRILAAVYRVVAPNRSGGRQGLALRLMVDPRRVNVRDAGAEQEAPLSLVAAAAGTISAASRAGL